MSQVTPQQRSSFHTGKNLLSYSLVGLYFYLFNRSSNQQYLNVVRDARQSVFGKVSESSIGLKINDEYQYSVEQLTDFAVTGLGILFILSAVFIRLGAYRFGALLLTLVQSFVIYTKILNPLFTDSRLTSGDKNNLVNQFLLQLSVIGAALMLLLDKGDPYDPSANIKKEQVPVKQDQAQQQSKKKNKKQN
eukprot:403374031